MQPGCLYVRLLAGLAGLAGWWLAVHTQPASKSEVAIMLASYLATSSNRWPTGWLVHGCDACMGCMAGTVVVVEAKQATS